MGHTVTKQPKPEAPPDAAKLSQATTDSDEATELCTCRHRKQERESKYEHTNMDRAEYEEKGILVYLQKHEYLEQKTSTIKNFEKELDKMESNPNLNKAVRQKYEDCVRENDCYEMRNGCRGKGLVITMTHDYDSWQADVKAVHRMFLYLNIMPVYHYDLTGKTLVDKMCEFAHEGQDDTIDYLFVVLLGHGGSIESKNKEYFCTADGSVFIMWDGLKFVFNNKDNPGLVDKPKIVLIDACRGGRSDRGLTRGKHFKTARHVGTFTDYFIGFASPPGTMTYYSTGDVGSWYIQEVSRTFLEYAANKQLSDIMRKVNENLQKKCSGENFTITPQIQEHLTRPLYLFPQLHKTSTPDDLSLGIFVREDWLHLSKKTDKGSPVCVSRIRWLRELPKLKTEKVKVVKFSLVKLLCVDLVFAFISQCSNCTQLLLYDCSDSSESVNNTKLADHLAKSIKHLTQLIEIHFKRTKLSAGSGAIFKSISSKKLRILIFEYDNLLNQGQALGGLILRSPQLRFLDLAGSCMKEEELIGVVSQLPHSSPLLQALRIGQNDLSNSGDKLPNIIKELPKLRALTIGRCKLPVDTMQNVVQNVNKNTIEFLEMHYNHKGFKLDSSVSNDLRWCKSLKWLRVSSWQFEQAVLTKLKAFLSGRGGDLLVDIGAGHDLWQSYMSHLENIRDECL